MTGLFHLIFYLFPEKKIIITSKYMPEHGFLLTFSLLFCPYMQQHGTVESRTLAYFIQWMTCGVWQLLSLLLWLQLQLFDQCKFFRCWKLKIWYVSTHKYVASENMLFSSKISLILMISAFFLQKSAFFWQI